MRDINMIDFSTKTTHELNELKDMINKCLNARKEIALRNIAGAINDYIYEFGSIDVYTDSTHIFINDEVTLASLD